VLETSDLDLEQVVERLAALVGSPVAS
jgi:hypothetical protein